MLLDLHSECLVIIIIDPVGFCSGGFTLVRTPDDLSPLLCVFRLSGLLGDTRKHPPSPAWHRNQRRLRARARVAVRSGLASKDQTLRLQRHHGSTLPKAMTWYGGAGNSSWCAGCRSWKWEGGTRCCCKTKKGAKKAQSDEQTCWTQVLCRRMRVGRNCRPHSDSWSGRERRWWLRRTQK